MSKPPDSASSPIASQAGRVRGKRTPAYVAIAIAVCTLLLHICSYRWSPSLALLDVCVTCDEGLISLLLPLTRLTATGEPSSHLMLYKRDPLVWTAGVAGRTPLRSWMASLSKVRCDGAMFADFGYWKGGWQSNSRPGPFVVVFAPVWTVGVAAFGLFLLLFYKLLRFRLRSLFVLMTLCGGIAWLLALRAPV